MVIEVPAVLFTDHVYSEDAQCFKIVVQTLSVSRHIICLKLPYDLGHGDHMLVIRPLKHDAGKVIKL